MTHTMVAYVIGSAETPVKIGIASSVKERLAQLQTGNPDALICHHFVRMPSSVALKVEQAAHRAFADRHRLGEWFNIHWTEAARLLEDMAALEEDAEGPMDLFGMLRTGHGLKIDGRRAAWDYLDRMDAGDAYVAHANGFILKKAGTAAYAAFSVLIAQRKPLPRMSEQETKAALDAVAKAINVLCNFRRTYQEKMRQAEIGREMRAARPLNSTKPISVPPLRKDR